MHGLAHSSPKEHLLQYEKRASARNVLDHLGAQPTIKTLPSQSTACSEEQNRQSNSGLHWSTPYLERVSKHRLEIRVGRHLSVCQNLVTIAAPTCEQYAEPLVCGLTGYFWGLNVKTGGRFLVTLPV